MSFSSHFEKKVNEEMMHEDGQPGRAPAEMEDADMALKKTGYPSSQFDGQDSHDKKDYPPRFSTLFGVAPPAPPPPPPHAPREYVREHYPEPKRRSGIHMPLALFIVLMITLFSESTIIFAYTIIGLYNNAPARLFPWAGQGTAVAATCGSSSQQQPAINIAPNFVMPGQAGAEQQHVTTELITITATPSTSSSSTSTSTSTTNASSQAAAMASDIADILGSLGLGGASSTTSSSIALVTVKPTQSTVTSVTVITETPPGPTVTQTTFVDAPKGTASSTTEQEEIIIRPTTLSSSAA